MANTLIKAVKTQHFSPSDSEIRRAAMLNDLLSEVRILASTLSSIIGTGLAGASVSVVTETAFGQAPNAGAAAAYSRGDHTHGSPHFPTITEGMVDDTIATAEDVRRLSELTQELRLLLHDLVRIELGQAPETGLVG